jgi:hypothetical protein
MSKVTQARKARTRPRRRSRGWWARHPTNYRSIFSDLNRAELRWDADFARLFQGSSERTRGVSCADIALDDYGDWLRSCKWKIEIAYDDAAGELPLGD